MLHYHYGFVAQAFLITFSDSLEAFLVVAAAVAFLRKTRQHALASAVNLGIGVSIVASLAGAWAFANSDHQALWEGRFAGAAAAGVAALGLYMWRTRGLLTDGTARTPGSGAAAPAFFFFTVLVVSREGMHTVLLIGTFVVQIPVPDLAFAVVSGVVFAELIAWLWARYGHRLRLSLFVPITVIVLVVAMTQLVSDAVENLANAGTPPPVMQLEFGPQRRPESSRAIFLGHGKASHGRVALMDR
ncbi:MAG TPA: FTR1 family protein [Vicinamibacterales bacterium]|nr:FTR1 family protein [Vicinamibacterales bacterium]